MIFKVLHQASKECVFGDRLRVANQAAVPPCARHSHIHPALVRQKANLPTCI